MPERHQAGIADEKVEADRKQRPDRHVGGEVGVERRAEQRNDEGRDKEKGTPRNPLRHRSAFPPSSPVGRRINTATIKAPTAKSEKRGIRRMPNENTRP